MASITVQPDMLLERILTLEIVRVTERAAVSSARCGASSISCPSTAPS
jgi:fructose-1,6-bisphosphatase II / sedoheptulose-1,7-bisphosphatase